jgi:hypothetical protein
MKNLLLVSFLALSAAFAPAADKDQWVPLFDGKSLDNWKISEKPGTFSVKDGELVIHGERSHMYYAGPVNNADFKNFELRLEIMAKPSSNSGVFFFTEYNPDNWPQKGYEIQVNNTHPDPRKTGGIWGVKDNMTAPAKDNEWFTMEIKVVDGQVTTKVDGKVIVEYALDLSSPRGNHGTIAIQGHDPASEVHYRKVEIKVLP